MSQLDEQFNTKGIFYLKTALAIFSGSGDPNSIEDGALGCLYIDEATGDLYQKTTAIGTLTGWSVVSGGGGGGTPGGSNTEVQFNNAGSFGGITGVTSDGTSLFISALNLQADTPTFLNDVAFVKNNISNVTDDGINLVNQTAAIAGGQQFSPGIRFTGNGWKTSAGGASQAMDAIAQLQTVQGTSVPTSNLVISFQSNGTGYTPRFTFGNTGRLTVDESLVAASVASSIYTSDLTNSTYLQLTSGAAASGVTLAVAGGGTNENLSISPKGGGLISITNTGYAGVLQLRNSSGGGFLGFFLNSVYSGGIGSEAQWVGSGSSTDLTIGAFAQIKFYTGNSVTAAGVWDTSNRVGINKSTSLAAQLDTLSGSTTRPAARFQAASGTSATQRLVDLYTGASADIGGFTAGGSLVLTNLGTAPTASVTDSTLQYTKDVATGKAENFVRNEYGEITRVTACTRVLTEDFGAGSTTLANVTATSIYGALSFDVEASTPYRFRAFLRVAADATGGFKVAINGTATATSVWYNIQAMGISAGSVINTLWTSLGSSSGTNGVIDYFVQIEGYILVNAAGTLTVQFANNSATGTSLCKEGSSFTIAQGNR